jgi:hypothetical protein
LWAGGFGFLVVLWILCGRFASTRDIGGLSVLVERTSAPSWRHRLLWLVLAAVPSSLLLGVTTHVTT